MLQPAIELLQFSGSVDVWRLQGCVFKADNENCVYDFALFQVIDDNEEDKSSFSDW
jgi:hypothetical protein